MRPEFISVGKLIAPHGVRGDVSIMPLTDFPDRFHELKYVFLDKTTKLEIETVRNHKNAVLLKFRHFDDRNSVESLRGKILYITEAELATLPEGRYYQFDLIGLTVYDEAGTLLGKLTDILETGSNDVYVVEADGDGQKPLLVPALKSVVSRIDLDAGKMVVKLQEEWEE